jgi:hypothetical protein
MLDVVCDVLATPGDPSQAQDDEGVLRMTKGCSG